MIGRYRVPRLPRYFNSGMALVLYILGIYHYTQPNDAWRSGTIEVVTASCLLTAVFLVPLKVAIVVNLFFALLLAGLGIRHCAIGGGWVSGSIELVFTALLVYGAVSFDKAARRKT